MAWAVCLIDEQIAVARQMATKYLGALKAMAKRKRSVAPIHLRDLVIADGRVVIQQSDAAPHDTPNPITEPTGPKPSY